jgi:hypothetical protein
VGGFRPEVGGRGKMEERERDTGNWVGKIKRNDNGILMWLLLRQGVES